MGEYADMILDGTFDEETGEYIGGHNLAKYGTESPGYPVSLAREARERDERKGKNTINHAAQQKTKCPDCGKKVKVIGLAMHRHDVHGS